MYVFPTSSDDFTLESEWQQVSPNFQDSSKYPDRFQQCCGLDSFNSSSNLLFIESLFWILEIILKALTTICFSVTHLFYIFSSLARAKYLSRYYYN